MAIQISRTARVVGWASGTGRKTALRRHRLGRGGERHDAR